MSTLTPLVVWGAASHALVISDILRLMGLYEIVGYLDDFSTEPGAAGLGAPLLGGREQLDPLREAGTNHIIIGVGDNDARLKLAEYAVARGFTLVSAIHPSAVIARGVEIGAGSVLVAGSIVNPGARIGANVIINTGATVEHECVIREGAHVGPGVHLGGRATIGRGAWIALGATVVDDISIGAGAIVGAGAVVLHNIPAHMLAYGIPAKIIREVSSHAAQE